MCKHWYNSYRAGKKKCGSWLVNLSFQFYLFVAAPPSFWIYDENFVTVFSYFSHLWLMMFSISIRENLNVRERQTEKSSFQLNLDMHSMLTYILNKAPRRSDYEKCTLVASLCHLNFLWFQSFGDQTRAINPFVHGRFSCTVPKFTAN